MQHQLPGCIFLAATALTIAGHAQRDANEPRYTEVFVADEKGYEKITVVRLTLEWLTEGKQR
jgi:hypothetical protein